MDSLIPQPGNPMAWDRCSYVHNNPTRYTDPSGHDICDDEGNCFTHQKWYRESRVSKLNVNDTWKMMILGKYHIMMSDTGDKNWD